MTSEQKVDPKISRRTIAKGAAWSLPVIATAVAAPSASASPVCAPCLGANVVSAGATIATVSGNKGNVVIAGAFSALATACTGLITAGIATINSATLTTNHGSYNTTTGLTGGPMVGGVIALGSAITFSGVAFPDGLYVLNSGPVNLMSLCFDVTIPLQIGGTSTPCGQTICFKPTVSLGVGNVTLGSGTVTFTTGWTFLSNG